MTSNTPPEPPADPSLLVPVSFVRGRRYSLQDDLNPIIGGKVILPNFEPIRLELAVYRASSWYGTTERGNAKLDHGYAHSALFFLDHGQGGGLQGSGMVMTVGNKPSTMLANINEPIAGRFAICKHKKTEGAGANHSRGWHPGFCSLCGLDLSVDSGD